MRKSLPFAFLLLLLAPLAVSQDSATGDFFHNGSFELSDLDDLVEVQQADRTEFKTTNGTKIFDEDEGLNMPTGLIVLILAFLGIVIYSVDLDPFWIAILLFLLVFSAVVYYLSLPEYLILLVALLIVVVKHFR